MLERQGSSHFYSGSRLVIHEGKAYNQFLKGILETPSLPT